MVGAVEVAKHAFRITVEALIDNITEGQT